MPRIPLSAQALAAAMNAELYRRGVPAFVRVVEVVRAPEGEGTGGADWTFALERSPVPLHGDDTAARYAQALFRYDDEVDAVARVTRNGDGGATLGLSDGSVVHVSRRRAPEVWGLLEG